MHISLNKISKRFSNKEWIIKNLSYEIKSGDRVAIVGNNGSGKSTLLKILLGMIIPTSGLIEYNDQNKTIHADELYRSFSFAAPYLELIEEFTLTEFLRFHFQFKKLRHTPNLEELIKLMLFEGHKHKTIRNFSSGMKQRLKLGLCFYSSGRVILLDEPTSNLDQIGIKWYHDQVSSLDPSQTIIVASNQKYEYQFCNKIIDLNPTLNK